MKRLCTPKLALLAALSAATPALAQKNPFYAYAGGEISSCFLWRGLYQGGVAIQPYAEAGYGGFSIGLWGSLHSSDNRFDSQTALCKTIQTSLAYSYKGLKAEISHDYYFYGGYHDFSNSWAVDPDNVDNLLEASLQYTVSETLPLTAAIHTIIGGDDGFFDIAQPTRLRRAYSTYIELSYAAQLPWQLQLTPSIGFSPWRSLYTKYENRLIVNNLQLLAQRDFTLGDNHTLSIFALTSANFYNIKDFRPTENLNALIGVGFWL